MLNEQKRQNDFAISLKLTWKVKIKTIIIRNRRFYITLKCPEGNFNYVNIIFFFRLGRGILLNTQAKLHRPCGGNLAHK